MTDKLTGEEKEFIGTVDAPNYRTKVEENSPWKNSILKISYSATFLKNMSRHFVIKNENG